MTNHIPFLLRVNRLEDAEKMLDYANEIIRVLDPSIQQSVMAKMIDENEKDFNGYERMPGIAIYYDTDEPDHDMILQRIAGAVMSKFQHIEIC